MKQMDDFKAQMLASIQMQTQAAAVASTPGVPDAANRFGGSGFPGVSAPAAAGALPASVLQNPFAGSSWSGMGAATFNPPLSALQPKQQHHSTLVQLDDDDEDSDVEELIERIRAAHAKSVNPSALHPPPEVTSEVMGPQHLVQSCEIDDLRDSRISSLQASMNSPDKKRLARYLSVLSFAFSDVMAVITRSATMFPYPDLMKLAKAKDQGKMEDLWRADQLLVRSSLETMREKLRGFTAHLHLANDKALNPYGFATVDRMERTSELEKVATKTELESFKAAVAAQDKDSVKRKRSRPAKNNNGRNKKKKPNSNNNPDFARCAACNKFGHVAGDARCKAAAPKPAAT